MNYNKRFNNNIKNMKIKLMIFKVKQNIINNNKMKLYLIINQIYSKKIIYKIIYLINNKKYNNYKINNKYNLIIQINKFNFNINNQMLLNNNYKINQIINKFILNKKFINYINNILIKHKLIIYINHNFKLIF